MNLFSHELNTTVKLSANRLHSVSDYASCMDIFEIRHRNLMAIIQAIEARGVTKNKDQAQQLGALGASYLSQLKSGKRIGEDTARKVEAATGRVTGWMDQPQWEGGEIQSHSQPLRLDADTLRNTIIGIRRTNKEYSLDDVLNNPAKFVEAYELLVGMIPKPVPDNLSVRGVHADKTPQGAEKDGRSNNVPVRGTVKRKMGSGRAGKA